MVKKNKIYFWSVHIDYVATIKSIINTCISLKKFKKDKYDLTILNAIGEWEEYNKELIDNNINIKSLFNKNIYNKIPKGSFLKSRLSYWIIFFKSFLKLKKLICTDKPDILVAHLMVSVPLTIYLFFNIKTKLILRISGRPKLNILRKILWKLVSKKIYKVITPTDGTKEELIKSGIFEMDKITTIRDPIINLKKIIEFKNEKIEEINFFRNNIILVGRLTRQKNFNLFLDCFFEIHNKYPDLKVNIFGDGEQKNELKEKVKKMKLESKFFFGGYKKNIFKYLFKSKYFILPSLWEDPGFALVEAAFANNNILSSNCEHGPEEFIGKDQKNGFLFKNNSKDELIFNFEKMINSDPEILFKKRLCAKKECKKFMLLRHSKQFDEVINS